MVSHLSCHYSIFIFFLLVDVFRIFVLRYFFITFLFRKQIGKVSSESFLANMPYTRSSLTIVRSCLRQFMQSPFKGLYRYFLHIELAICKITITTQYKPYCKSFWPTQLSYRDNVVKSEIIRSSSCDTVEYIYILYIIINIFRY